jgi:hypothetical protein
VTGQLAGPSIEDVNRALLELLRTDSLASLSGSRPGELFRCAHAEEMEGGCGTSYDCRFCGAAQAIVEAQQTKAPAARECTIIGRQADIEAIMAATFETREPKVIGNDYEVIGTIDRADWCAGAQAATPPVEVLDRVYVFEDVWRFEVEPGGWYPASS